MSDSVIPSDPFSKPVQDYQDKKASAKEVQEFHKNSDVDSSKNSQHHTLGSKRNQAAPGDHTHNGEDSLFILEGVTLTGSKGGNAALASVIAALVSLGATDNTT